MSRGGILLTQLRITYCDRLLNPIDRAELASVLDRKRKSAEDGRQNGTSVRAEINSHAIVQNTLLNDSVNALRTTNSPKVAWVINTARP